MSRIDDMLGELMQIQTGSGNLGDSILQMNAENLEASGLDDVNYVLVRLAALIAVGAPTGSYEAVLELARDAEVSASQVAGVLIAVAPTAGGPRVLEAAARLSEAGDDLLRAGPA